MHQLAEASSRGGGHKPGSLRSLRPSRPTRSAAGGTDRRPVSYHAEPSHGNRGANEPARSCNWQGLALRCRQHQHSQKPSKVASCASNFARGDFQDHFGWRTGFPPRSVAKWLQFETPPDRKRAVLKRSSAWYFEEYLKQRWENGIRGGNALLPLIQERGYGGSLSNKL